MKSGDWGSAWRTPLPERRVQSALRPRPVASVPCGCCKHFHQLDSLKQNFFSPSQFWRPEPQISFTGPKSKRQQGHGPSRGSGVSEPLPRLFGLLACARAPWLVASPPRCLRFFRLCQISLRLSLIRVLVISFKAHLNNPGHGRYLSYSYEDPFSK